MSRPILSVDLDSTLCDTGNREFDRENPDWVDYSMQCERDTPIAATMVVIHAFAAAGHDIHYVSGRDQRAEELTRKMLTSWGLPIHGLWLADDEHGNHVIEYGSHAKYKVAKVKQVEAETSQQVILHLDDWAEVKHELELNGYPCMCVRTPQEIADAVSEPLDQKLIL